MSYHANSERNYDENNAVRRYRSDSNNKSEISRHHCRESLASCSTKRRSTCFAGVKKKLRGEANCTHMVTHGPKRQQRVDVIKSATVQSKQHFIL